MPTDSGKASKRPAIPIGAIVRVSARWVKRKAWSQASSRYVVTWQREPVELFIAVVSGYGRRLHGTIMPGGYDDQASFHHEGSTFVVLIRRGMTNREIPVPVDAIEPCDGSVPLVFCRMWPWSEREKAVLRDETAKIPREANGRWRA